MEYYVGLEGRRLDVEWNGTNDGLYRITFARYSSRALSYKCYLYLPKMPTNHSICLRRRIVKSWSDHVGSTQNSARRIISLLDRLNYRNGLHVQDDILLPLVEGLTLDDVAVDLDIIGFYQSGTRRQRKIVFIFGFSPDNISHYLEQSVTRGGLMCYGRNGDLSL